MNIICNGCSKVFKQGDSDFVAVHPVTLSFDSSINILIGKSGSGKSTFLYMLAGLDSPTNGSIYYNDVNLYDKKTNIENIRCTDFGFIFQNYNLIAELTVKDNILLPLYFNKHTDIDDYNIELEYIANRLNISNILKKRPNILSGGECQRVAIARALIHKPSVIFADEPTGNLDEINGNEVINILISLVKENKCCLILVTHDKDFLQLADNIFVMKDGFIEKQC